MEVITTHGTTTLPRKSAEDIHVCTYSKCILATRQVMSMSERRWTYQAKGKGKDCGKLQKPSPYLKGTATMYGNHILPGRIIGLRLTNSAIFLKNLEIENFS